MNRIWKLSRIGLMGAVALALAAGLAEGAWLVTVDGSRIETRGPWQVKGGLVVFTSAEGVLSSIRLTQCDLEASAAATEAAARARAETTPPPPPRRRPVLVLTDADVGHVRPAAATGGEAEAEEGDAAAPAAPTGVVVGDWQPKDEEDGISITGMVRNDGPHVAGRIKVVAVFRDADGDEIESRPATLSTSTLAPGQRAQFRVPSFGLFSYSQVDFDVQHFDILTKRSDPEAEPSGHR